MGCNFSKNSSVNPPPLSQSTPTNLPDLTSYEAACRVDPELRSFDSTVHHRTTRVLSSLAGSVEVRSISLDSLREVTESLLEMDQDVVKVILDCKKDIWKNEELFNLVDDYFKNSIETLNFCNALNNCLKCARDSQFNLNVALWQFDSAVHHRTTRVLSSVEVRSISLDSLREVAESLLEMDQDVVKVILDGKKDIWKNEELFNLVDDYFKNSIETLNFCIALNNCLKRSRDSQFNLNVTLRQFEEEKRNGAKEFSHTLQEFEKLKASGESFGDEFFVLFQSIYEKQMVMFYKLQAEKFKLDKKLKSVKKWGKLSNVLFVVTFTTVFICSVLAAAIVAPPVLTSLAAAVPPVLTVLGKWVNSIWKKYENEVKEKQDFIGSMELGTFIVIKDLDNIRVLVDKLEIKMESLLYNTDFALREGEALELAIDEIKKELSGFTQTIEDLSHYADKCGRDVGRARTMILHKMTKYPSA